MARGLNGRLVPPGPLEIDKNHPLTRGLIGCWVPGVNQGVDLTGYAPTLTQGGGGFTQAGPEGVGWKGTAANSVLTYVVGNNARWASFNSFSQLSLYWRGTMLGAPTASCAWIGASYDNANSSPFVLADVGTDGTATLLQVDWNNGGFSHFTYGSVPAAGNLLSVGMTGNFSGNMIGYQNGLNVASQPGGGGSPINTATSTLYVAGAGQVPTRITNAICYIGLWWNRQLSDAEMLQIHLQPYVFIRPKLFWPGFDALGLHLGPVTQPPPPTLMGQICL